MIKFYYSVILFFIFTSAHAHLHENEALDNPFNFKTPDNTEPFQAVEHQEEYSGCGGYLRAGFIQTDHSSASAIGGELGCGYQLNQYIKAHVGLFASFDPGINSQNDNNVQDDFFNYKKDSYLIVGEAVITLSYDRFEAHLGRQNFDSPHMDADDLRMIANLFEAYLLDYHFSDSLYFGAGFIREAAGWENGANISQFVSIGEAFGGEDRGAWVTWLNYEQENITGDTWFYYIPDHLTIFYSELIYSEELTDNLSYSFGLQYDWGKDTGRQRLGEVNSQTLGVMASVKWTDLTFTAAYNKNFSQTGAIASIGGGPYFTSFEELTLDAVEAKNSQSVLLSLEYSLNDDLTIGSAVGKFRASSKNQFNQEEINLYINYHWNNMFATEVMYAVVDDLNSEPDLHQIRVILTYQF